MTQETPKPTTKQCLQQDRGIKLRQQRLKNRQIFHKKMKEKQNQGQKSLIKQLRKKKEH